MRRVRAPHAKPTSHYFRGAVSQFVTEALSCAPRCVAQGGKLPLHYAAENGTSLEVVKLLLKANPEAARNRDKVCRCVYVLGPTLQPGMV